MPCRRRARWRRCSPTQATRESVLAGTAATVRPRLTVQSGRLARAFSVRNLIVVAVVVVVAYIGAVPLGFLLWQTFVHGGTLSIESFRGAYSDIGIGEMMANSLAFAFGSCA